MESLENIKKSDLEYLLLCKEKLEKHKEYLRKSAKKYYEKKKQENPEFLKERNEKAKNTLRERYQKDEKYREYCKNKNKAYREKKKMNQVSKIEDLGMKLEEERPDGVKVYSSI